MATERTIVPVANDADANVAVIVTGRRHPYRHPTLVIRVSSSVLEASPGSFKDCLLRTGFSTSREFEEHTAKGSSKLFELLLDHDSPDGIMRLCAALHKRRDLIPCGDGTSARDRWAVTSEFADTVDKYNCFSDDVKHAAKLSLQDVSMGGTDWSAEYWLRWAAQFESTDCFSQLTDIVVKYRSKDQVDYIRRAFPDSNDRLHGIDSKLVRFLRPEL